jgi:plasmid stabilization system protein ParE
LDDAYLFYEQQQPGLGKVFLNEILSAFKRIKSYPESWPPFSKRTRRYLTNKFPYGIIYQVRVKDKEILIVAIAHLHREPGYWKDRLK